MKFLLVFIMLTFVESVKAQQNNLVEYSIQFKDNTNDKQSEYLVFNLEKLVYANISNSDNLNFEDEKLDKSSFQYEPLFFDLKNDSVYQLKIGIFDPKSSDLTRFVAGEKTPKLDWKLTKETKKILNYICYKATTKFRGRDYIAWFTPEIAHNYGPWKLNGLPGLILKAETDLFSYEAKRIVLNSDKIPNLDYLFNLKNAKVIHTLKESFDYENNWLEYQMANFVASLPSGAIMQEVPLRNNSREFTLDE